MRALAGLVAIGLTVPAFAGDARLQRIRDLLLPMRAEALEHLETRGARPQFTVIKHGLREWIESRLGGLNPSDDPALLAHQLNLEIAQEGLTCQLYSTQAQTGCPDLSLVGFLGPITITKHEFLIVQTSVGIQQCGFDESAYAYRWEEKDWRRFWESEQNEYTEEKYRPQNLRSVMVSPTNSIDSEHKNEHLVLTLGIHSWCTSNWQPVYFRVWQTKKSYSESKILLDGEDDSTYLGIFEGNVRSSDVLIEYAVDSIDGAIHNRREIQHYVLKQGKLERVDPICLSPRDFADWWIRHPWSESVHWTLPSVRSALETWHAKRGGRDIFGDFIAPSMHCRRPDLWQVGIGLGVDEERTSQYFLIRWRPPYLFTMAGVSDHPWSDCSEEDPEADEERTLFPGTIWP